MASKRINKLIQNEDMNDAVDAMKNAQKVANSIIKIKSEASPSPYDGRGSTAYCHYYNPRSYVIPVEIREPKYISQRDDATPPDGKKDQELVRASRFSEVKAFELQVIGKVKSACKVAKARSLAEAQRVTQLETARASFQNSINQMNLYKQNIENYIASHGSGSTLPLRIGFTSAGAKRIYGDYRGMNAGLALQKITQDIADVQANIDDTNATIEKISGIADIEVDEDAVKKLEAVKTDLVMLKHLQAIVDASDSIAKTIKSFGDFYDANDRCATTCQIYCQQACQNACQNNCTCHDQKCGAH